MNQKGKITRQLLLPYIYDSIVKNHNRDGKEKKSNFKARKFLGMRRTYSTLNELRMQRNTEIGFFAKPSFLIVFV
jgi:hypothetical protein